ncbi:hypothetical protein B0I08_10444 [Glaciihabitans tibetensis]|uniref:Uncharacterized protein n=1 Tax=Glaciihabitans tibetensis TaxID=1266600 RepID=A0A2T0VDY7_9MICO|nr:hypothetical protein [Glaciihabitans tibetensis]PRY68342.1 hypothetical protein B0I08_10444 [Glaciihabitans tibetensis]
MTQAGPSKYATEIVRVFPDYAGSVIWFIDPVPYAESQFSAGLAARLVSWEGQYYASLDDDLRWRSLDTLHTFSAEGLELAREVSGEIGPEFLVEYRSSEDSGAVAQLRSETPASNPAARAAFRTRAAREREEWAALQSARTRAAKLGVSPARENQVDNSGW